ncbi:hypothetical protein INT48_006082, partial [Thamnidium elegans]
DTTLFILFGRGVDGALNPSLLTIDVASASNIIYTANYVSNSTSNLNDSNSNGSGGLSKGTVGGIATGSIVFVGKNNTVKILLFNIIFFSFQGLGIIAFVFFCLRRQKKATKQDVHENMDVDWDKIEEHYKEVPTAESNFPQLSESPEANGKTSVGHHFDNLTESTAINNNPDVVVSIGKHSVNTVDAYERSYTIPT